MSDAFEIARDLLRFAREQGFVPPPAFYIVGSFNLREADGSAVYSDEAHMWCEPCADKLLARAHALLPAEQHEDHFVCETDANGEDSCPHCRACGETLDGEISSYAVSEEVAHYAEHPIEAGDTINSRQAVEIAQLLFAGQNDADVLAIGKAALTCIQTTKDSPDA